LADYANQAASRLQKATKRFQGLEQFGNHGIAANELRQEDADTNSRRCLDSKRPPKNRKLHRSIL